jgi:hypothetical protein
MRFGICGEELRVGFRVLGTGYWVLGSGTTKGLGVQGLPLKVEG